MSNIPAELKYTKDHEWVRIEGDSAVIGITHYAQSSLGDVTFVELPDEGDSFGKGDSFSVVESVKAASDIYMPFEGEVLEVNTALDDAPEQVNSNPYGDGWIVKFKVNDVSELEDLLSAEDYSPLASE